jgi:hypothetical protein
VMVRRCQGKAVPLRCLRAAAVCRHQVAYPNLPPADRKYAAKALKEDAP